MLSLHKDALTVYSSYIDPKYHSGKESQDYCNTEFFQGSFPPWRWSRNGWRLVALRNSISRGTMVTVSVVAPWHVCLSLKFLPRHNSLNLFLWYLSNTGPLRLPQLRTEIRQSLGTWAPWLYSHIQQSWNHPAPGETLCHSCRYRVFPLHLTTYMKNSIYS